MYSSYNYDSSSEVLAIFSIIFIIFGFIIILSMIPAIIQLIGTWKTFKKAGKGGWEALIPYYSQYVQFKISGVSPWFLLMYLVPIILLPLIFWSEFVFEISNDPALIIPVIVVNLLVCASSIALTVLQCYAFHKLAKSFGKDIGFTIGLIFFPWVFLPIIGFSKSITYVGPNGVSINNDIVENTEVVEENTVVNEDPIKTDENSDTN